MFEVLVESADVAADVLVGLQAEGDDGDEAESNSHVKFCGSSLPSTGL